MTMVIITAGINLSVGSVAALSGVLGAMMVVEHGVSVPVAIIGGAAIGAIAGVVNGLLVTQAGMAPFSKGDPNTALSVTEKHPDRPPRPGRDLRGERAWCG
jgi:predicted ABC-type sugar transport system permease subunit